MKKVIADIILGNNIDIQYWIEDLIEKGAEHIIVLDYDYYGEQYEKEKITYISPLDIQKWIRQFDTVYFYKSLYAFPGMSGKMSSIVKKNK